MILSRRMRGRVRVRYIGQANAEFTTGNFNISIGGVNFDDGDLGLLFVAHDNQDTSFTVIGWTELIASNVSAPREYSVWTRTLSSSDSSVVSASFSGTSAGTALFMAFKNATITSGDCASAYQNSGGGAVAPNPPASAVSNIQTTDMVVILGMHDQPGAVITGPPTDISWTTIVNKTTSVAGCTIGAAHARNIEGSINPGSFVTTGHTDSTWAAHTLVLRGST